ncbi:Arginine-glutamic acid dipeptide repeat protein [Quillaja saponaria]|nr:Arginine-glutamic acid dipeptide repeat protein [Quillaja saponaria]
MQSFQLEDDDNCIEDRSSNQSNAPSSPGMSTIVGARQLNPRLGDEYQVEIPSMITESEHLQLLKNPADSEMLDVMHSFAIGLPIPLMSIRYEVVDIEAEGCGSFSDNDNADNVPEPTEARKEKTIMGGKVLDLNVESLDFELDNRQALRQTVVETTVAGEAESGQWHRSKIYCLVPGSLGNHWKDGDVKNFLLGLFIFGKNFKQIKRLIENKEMGDILSFYYGEFYRSDGYRRWSNSRKIKGRKGRKCIRGKKIFTGWRQHELLSRLLPYVSKEFKDTFLEVSKSYADGRASLEEYVSFLKSTVGLSTLVEAVGIGEGKKDLTTLSLEPGKNNQVFPIPPSTPAGKAWSSLEPSEIMKFLTGGVRLSKARCNDIFWEAVWPRLLARGWHSEQPKNQGYLNSKDNLVFLIPGINKFSRRKLVKGYQYFDSVSDVLRKVTSEPKLLELEVEEARVASCNEEDGCVPGATSDQDDPSDDRRHCYLKPRVSTYSSDHMKFTIVDTSALHGGKSSNVRELKYLPFDFKMTSKMTSKVANQLRGNGSNYSLDKVEVDAADMPLTGDKNINEAKHSNGMSDGINQKLMKFTVVDTSLLHGGKSSKVRELRYAPVPLETSELTDPSRETEGSSSEDSIGEVNAVNKPLDGEMNISNGSHCTGTSDGDDPNQKAVCDNSDNNANKVVEALQNQKINIVNDKPLKRAIKHQFSRRSKSGHSIHAAPVIKRRRLTACVKAETSRMTQNSSEGLALEKVGRSQSLNSHEASSKANSQVSHQVDVYLMAPSAEGSLEEEKNGGNLHKECSGMDYSKIEKCEPEPTINLNLPQVALTSENDELTVVVEEERQEIKIKDPCFTSDTEKLVPEALITSSDVSSTEQALHVNPRRQSTRNRPLTIRALESLANEYLHVERKQKKKETRIHEKLFNPCRRARSRTKVSSNRSLAGAKAMITVEENHFNEAWDISKDIVSKPPDQIEE